jgi:hypothetical protein
MTPEEKAEYLQGYLESEGIQLDPTQVVHNPGRRTTSKQGANSMWGKGAQRTNLPQIQVVQEASKFWALASDPQYRIQWVYTYPESELRAKDMMEVVYTEHESLSKELPHTNLYLAAFTTAQARLRLHQVLMQLGEDVLYFDTDSIIYKYSVNDTMKLMYMGT